VPPDAHLGRWRNAALSALSLGSAAALLVVGLPRVLHVGWAEIGRSLAEVPADVLASLVGLWLAGLCAYTVVTCAALPGLTRPRAFALNAVGGATSNLLPFGGTAGALLGYAMARSWGHDRRSVVTATVVSNTCNVLGRLLLPVVGLGALLLAGRPGGVLVVAAAVGAGACLVVAVGVGAVVWSGRVAAAVGRALDTAAQWLLPDRLRPDPETASHALHRLRTQVGDNIERRWPTLGLGMGATLALQAALFTQCLQAVGAHAPPTVALAAFAVSRALTVVVLTPNGIGVSETGTAAVLLALGVGAGPAAAAVLLFGLLTHVLEIAVGVLAGAGWAAGRRAAPRARVADDRRRRPPAGNRRRPRPAPSPTRSARARSPGCAR
jgi:putative heme transporter